MIRPIEPTTDPQYHSAACRRLPCPPSPAVTAQDWREDRSGIIERAERHASAYGPAFSLSGYWAAVGRFMFPNSKFSPATVHQIDLKVFEGGLRVWI